MNIVITKDQSPKHPRTFWVDALEEPRVIYRSNFEGKEITNPRNPKQIWNAAGKRNFCFVIPEQYVPELQERNWPIKKSVPNDGGDPTYYVAVKINFRVNENTGVSDPEIHKFYGLSDRNPIDITADNAADLDKQDIVGARFAVNESKDVYQNKEGADVCTLYLNYGEFYVLESNKFKARWQNEYTDVDDD
jgi:hypothetical protein